MGFPEGGLHMEEGAYCNRNDVCDFFHACPGDVLSSAYEETHNHVVRL